MTSCKLFLRLTVLPFSLLIACVSTEVIAAPDISSTHAIPVVSGVEQAPTEDVSRYEPVFQKDYKKNYAETGYGYDQYRPAYYLGYKLAKDSRFKNMQWDKVEEEARRNWDPAKMGLWKRYKDAVHFAWDRVRQDNR